MTNHAERLLRSYKSYQYFLMLIGILLLGFLVGINLYNPLSSELLRSAIVQPVTVVGLSLVIFLPLITIILAKRPMTVWGVFFLKAVAYGFLGESISHAFHGASWLVRLLFQFSDHCSMVLLIVFCHRHFYFANAVNQKAIFGFFLPGVLCAMCDFFIISPLLQGVL